MTDERALVERAAGGDPAALSQLVQTHRPTVLRTARHLLGDPDSAEDLTQDVFVRLQSSLVGFRHEAELSTWLYRVTLNLCRDHLKKRRWRNVDWDDVRPTSAHALAVEDDPNRAVDAERARKAVREAIAKLPDEQRSVVVLRYISDLPYSEIARITATPPGTVASRIFRALERLGQELESRHLEVLE